VKQVEEFRRNAAECRALADTVRDQETKVRMLELARQWEALALARRLLLMAKAHRERVPAARR
jgi:hypothetical protein